jgi:hypothetical protein
VTNVSITPAYNASLNLVTGVPGKGSAATQPIASWTGSGTTTVTGAARLVHTGGDQPVTVACGGIHVGTTPYCNRTAGFALGLEEGKQYTLTIDLKRPLVWAGSNVYWDNAGQKLTFDAPGSGDVAQRKQGVLFKWGSLVGVSPITSDGSGNDEGDPYYYTKYNVGVPIYHPVYSSPTWSWSTTHIYDDFEDIPYVDAPLPGDTYLNDDARNNPAYGYNYWGNSKGDICRFISENGFGPGGATNKYRMPTYTEMGQKSSYTVGSDGWTGGSLYGTDASNGGYADGTMARWEYLTHSYSGTIFPITGRRHTGGGNEYQSYGCYWSCSSSDLGLYSMMFYSNYSSTTVILIEANTLIGFAFAVRCVRAD